MARWNGLAFILGGCGLALFAGGLVLAFTDGAPAADCNHACQQTHYNALFGRVLFLWVAGILLEAVATVFLLLHFREQRARRAAQPRASATGTAPPAATRPGAATSPRPAQARPGPVVQTRTRPPIPPQP